MTSAAFVDVLEGRLAQGRELVEQYDLSKGPTAGTAKTKREKRTGVHPRTYVGERVDKGSQSATALKHTR